MSLSKVALKCQFCEVGKGLYSCPRCRRKYCSVYCYKKREHDECSEAFYREWVEETLRETRAEDFEQKQMINILKKEDIGNLQPVEIEVPFEEKFENLNVDHLDASDIWKYLSKEDREKYNSFIQDNKNLESILPLKEPWWTSQKLTLVTEIDSDANDLKVVSEDRPPFPLNFKKLSDLTSSKPSDCIPHNLVNILYAYAFLYRFYNCDLRDFLEEVVDSLFLLSPVLFQGRNYLTLAESVQDSIRLIMNKYCEFPLSFVKGIVNDVSSLMIGPENARSSTYVLCALHDIKLLLSELKFFNKKNEAEGNATKHNLKLIVKKIEYYISWSSENEIIVSQISSDLVCLMLPDLIPETTVSKDKVINANDKKALIEELD